jgi:hypothetical protein
VTAVTWRQFEAREIKPDRLLAQQGRSARGACGTGAAPMPDPRDAAAVGRVLARGMRRFGPRAQGTGRYRQPVAWRRLRPRRYAKHCVAGRPVAGARRNARLPALRARLAPRCDAHHRRSDRSPRLRRWRNRLERAGLCIVALEAATALVFGHDVVLLGCPVGTLRAMRQKPMRARLSRSRRIARRRHCFTVTVILPLGRFATTCRDAEVPIGGSAAPSAEAVHDRRFGRRCARHRSRCPGP